MAPNEKMGRLKIKSFVVAVMLLIVPAMAMALEHELNVGPEISHITYKEPGLMKEKGWFYGIAGSYTL